MTHVACKHLDFLLGSPESVNRNRIVPWCPVRLRGHKRGSWGRCQHRDGDPFSSFPPGAPAFLLLAHLRGSPDPSSSQPGDPPPRPAPVGAGDSIHVGRQAPFSSGEPELSVGQAHVPFPHQSLWLVVDVSASLFPCRLFLRSTGDPHPASICSVPPWTEGEEPSS